MAKADRIETRLDADIWAKLHEKGKRKIATPRRAGADNNRRRGAARARTGRTYVPGETLRELPAGSYEPEQAISWTSGLREILRACRTEGIRHRDVKPENCILGDDGKLWLVDFGLSSDVERVAWLGDAGGATGSLGSEFRPEREQGRSPHGSDAGGGHPVLPSDRDKSACAFSMARGGFRISATASPLSCEEWQFRSRNA